MLLLNHPELLQFIFFSNIFHKNSQTIHLYCLVNARNIYIKHSHCEPVYFITEIA